jgi:hypothetical protein
MKRKKTNKSFKQCQLIKTNMKNLFCNSHVRSLVSKIIQVVCLLRSEQPQSQKKNQQNINDENGGLPGVNLQLYDAFSLKRATIFNFDALFEYIGFERFFEFYFFVFV